MSHSQFMIETPFFDYEKQCHAEFRKKLNRLKKLERKSSMVIEISVWV